MANELAEELNFDEMEQNLEEEIELSLEELDELNKLQNEFSRDENLQKIVMDNVMGSFQTQLGIDIANEFQENNHDQTLDIRSSSHVQTEENFAKGKIANHNHNVDYQERFDTWDAKFAKDTNGNRKVKRGKEVLTKEARKFADKGRGTGSKSKNTAMDHTKSVGEHIRNAEWNTFMSEEEQLVYINSTDNLNEIDAAANSSKNDETATDWLESEKNGKTPGERFDINEEEIREKDAKIREQEEKALKENKQKEQAEGRKSQKAEAVKAAKSMGKAAVMQLLTTFLKEVLGKVFQWFKSKEKSLKSLGTRIKEAVTKFFSELKMHLGNVAKGQLGQLMQMVFGKIMEPIRRIASILKQGWASLKQAVAFLKAPENANMPMDLKIANVTKIVIAGVTGVIGVSIGGLIGSSMSSLDVIQIPLIGGLGTILGSFFGATIAGIGGALALKQIDKYIQKKQQTQLQIDIANKDNEILTKQAMRNLVAEANTEQTLYNVGVKAAQRHEETDDLMADMLAKIEKNNKPKWSEKTEAEKAADAQRQAERMASDQALNDLMDEMGI